MNNNKRKTINISGELHHFLTIQAVVKNESYENIIRRLLAKTGINIPVTPSEKVIKQT